MPSCKQSGYIYRCAYMQWFDEAVNRDQKIMQINKKISEKKKGSDKQIIGKHVYWEISLDDSWKKIHK